MKARFLNLLVVLKSGFIFVPTLMALGAVLLFFGTDYLDRTYPGAGYRWFYFGGPEGARLILATIASAMITVAGVVLSITVLILTLTSSQYGARLLRNFMRDPVVQIVIGIFTSSFIYCILVLREIRGEDVRQISVSTGVLLTVLSLFVLIYFIHHMSRLIQPENICKAVFADLDEIINVLMPGEAGQPPAPEPPQARSFGPDSARVFSKRSGYLESIDLDGMARHAARHGVVLKLKRRPGDFVVEGSVLALIRPRERMNVHLDRAVERAFKLGARLTLEQDIEFAFNQLVQVAVRALSPGINDPFTAMTCVDWIGVGISKVLQREFPSPYIYGRGGQLRIIIQVVTFDGITDTSFHQIRQAARENVAVSLRLLETIATAAERARKDEHKDALRRHAEMIRREMLKAGIDKNDLEDVEERFGRVLALVEGERKSAF